VAGIDSQKKYSSIKYPVLMRFYPVVTVPAAVVPGRTRVK
jgi:hypothetical protein